MALCSLSTNPCSWTAVCHDTVNRTSPSECSLVGPLAESELFRAFVCAFLRTQRPLLHLRSVMTARLCFICGLCQLEWVHFLCSLKEFLSFLLFLGGYYFTSTWTKLIFHENSLPFQGHTTGRLPNFFGGHRTTSWPMKQERN